MDVAHTLLFALAAAAGAFSRLTCSLIIEKIAHTLRVATQKDRPLEEIKPQESDTFVFPWSICIVNTLGCLGFGLSLSFIQTHSSLDTTWKTILCTGFFGSFTTFSTYIFEIYFLWKDGYYAACFCYIFGQLAFGTLAFYVGFKLFF